MTIEVAALVVSILTLLISIGTIAYAAGGLGARVKANEEEIKRFRDSELATKQDLQEMERRIMAEIHGRPT